MAMLQTPDGKSIPVGGRLAQMEQADIEDAERLGKHPENEERAEKAAGIAADRLRSIVERVERLEEERKSLGNDVKDIFHEAKGAAVSTTFDGRSSVRIGAAPVPRTRKPRAAIPAPEGVAAAPPNGATDDADLSSYGVHRP